MCSLQYLIGSMPDVSKGIILKEDFEYLFLWLESSA